MAPERVPCQVCGNDIDRSQRICPYCEGEQDAGPQWGAVPAASPSRPTLKQAGKGRACPPGGDFHKVVNLEAGRPIVEVALRKLEMALANGRQQHLSVLTVIHGYGSSGKGGAIGVECRKVLEYLQGSGQIHSFIPGEEFRQRSGPTRDLLRRFPRLADNVNLNKGNRGITLVVL